MAAMVLVGDLLVLRRVDLRIGGAGLLVGMGEIEGDVVSGLPVRVR